MGSQEGYNVLVTGVAGQTAKYIQSTLSNQTTEGTEQKCIGCDYYHGPGGPIGDQGLYKNIQMFDLQFHLLKILINTIANTYWLSDNHT